MAVLLARIRLPLQYVGFVLLFLGLLAVIANVLGAEFGAWPAVVLMGGVAIAADLIFRPDDAPHPESGRTWHGFHPASDFPAFGAPILAPADGIVVRRKDGARDHLSPSSWIAYAYLYAESVFRELRGVSGMLGNHLVLRLADGSHFVLAHLQRGSIRVDVGHTVEAGQVVAACGNSGNTTEPHVHCQRQDVANTFLAVGLPWTISPAGIPAEGASAVY